MHSIRPFVIAALALVARASAAAACVEAPRPGVAPLLCATAPARFDARVGYRELQRAEPDAHEFQEHGLNSLGYDLLRAGWPDAATAVFRFVTQTWPRSANAWDSYGEGLAAAGRRDAAIAAYSRSLQLDPLNCNAADRLAKLQQR